MTDDVHPVRLYLLQLGGGDMPTDPPLPMSLGCYLIQMSDGRLVLIDTGYPRGWETSARFAFLQIESDAVTELDKIGVQPGDIDILITTHFDPDHAGMHDAFASAEIVAQRDAWEAAQGGEERAAFTREHWGAPGLRYRLVEGDHALLPGIDLVATPGHAPGHQSILLRLPHTGLVLLAIDAAAQEAAFAPDRQPSPVDMDPAGAIQSTVKLLDLAAREQVDLVVFGHDGAQWARLNTAPAFYD